MNIWKWPLMTTYVQYISMPAGAKLLDVQMQGGQPCIWALVDEYAGSEMRQIAMLDTEDSIPAGAHVGGYVATFQDGGIVRHVFDVTPGRGGS
jgi:hypothetical protein